MESYEQVFGFWILLSGNKEHYDYLGRYLKISSFFTNDRKTNSGLSVILFDIMCLAEKVN